MSSFIENIEKQHYGALIDKDEIKNITVKDIEEFSNYIKKLLNYKKNMIWM